MFSKFGMQIERVLVQNQMPEVDFLMTTILKIDVTSYSNAVGG